MRPTDKIDNLIKKTLKTTASPELDQRIDTLIARSKPAVIRPNRWRIIIHSKITKYAAAAIILIATFLSLTVWDTTVTPAYAVQQMREAMKNVIWMHSFAETKILDDMPYEFWLSLSLGIEASRNNDGSASFQYVKEKEIQLYDPNTKTITLSVANNNNSWHKASTVTEFLDLIIESLNDNDNTAMTTKQEAENIIYEITIPRGDPPGSVGTEIWRLTGDKKSHLLTRMELEGWDKTGTFIKFADMSFDYPETGPMDIYELGVPRNAQIIDKRPTEDLKTIIDRYETTRENEPAHYTALILYTRQENGCQIADEATIFYTDGTLQRKEVLSIRLDFMGAQRKGESDLIRSYFKTKDILNLRD